MRTAFLGAYGYGNLGDELCLMEAMRAFPATEAHAFSVAPDWTMRCVPGLAGCFRDGAAMHALRPRRIVFGGGMFGVPEAFRAWMPHLVRADRDGAEIHLHNLGIAWLLQDLGWLDDAARGVIARARTFSVRDALGVERAAEAGFARLPRVTHFPEADILADPSLADELLPRDGPKLLGVSVIPTASMLAALERDAPRVGALLAPFAGHAILPIVSTVHADSAAEDDLAGFGAFRAAFLPGARIAAPALLDRGHWRAAMTPARLKGLIARCDALISQRKHNVVHAIGAGVRVLGLHPREDNSLPRTFIALAHRLPGGSRCIGLDRAA
jgi:hypothetical protein